VVLGTRFLCKTSSNDSRNLPHVLIQYMNVRLEMTYVWKYVTLIRPTKSFCRVKRFQLTLLVTNNNEMRGIKMYSESPLQYAKIVYMQ
jgi:hypothetical protein